MYFAQLKGQARDDGCKYVFAQQGRDERVRLKEGSTRGPATLQENGSRQKKDQC
jgi:hypothetical protein